MHRSEENIYEKTQHFHWTINVHCPLSGKYIRNNTYRGMDPCNWTDVFWIITNFTLLQKVTNTPKHHSLLPPSYFLPILHQSLIITIEELRIRSKLECEAELCFSIFSQDRLSESSYNLCWPGILLVAYPISTPAHFSQTKPNVLGFTILHHHHLSFHVLWP